jgi:hypothetical protein
MSRWRVMGRGVETRLNGMGVNHPLVLGCMGEGREMAKECIYAGRSCWAE